jgi:hypothetical protein
MAWDVTGLAPTYLPREPHAPALYRLVKEHGAEFLRHARDSYDEPLPRYVEDELRCVGAGVQVDLHQGAVAQQLKRSRLSPSGLRVLVRLARNAELRLSDLARAARLSEEAARAAVDRRCSRPTACASRGCGPNPTRSPTRS